MSVNPRASELFAETHVLPSILSADFARLGEVRRGVLNVTVAHPVLLEELSAFRKSDLLSALRRDAPGTVVHDTHPYSMPPEAMPTSDWMFW